MKFFDFVDKAPAIKGLAIVEGTERRLAERAVDLVVERLLPADLQALNLDTFDAGSGAFEPKRVADAVAAMPFLAERRVTVVRAAHALRAAPRRELWAIAQAVPAGNTLVLEDLTVPRKGAKLETFGQLAGRAALRIDTTANPDVRERYVRDELDRLGIAAEPPVIGAFVRSDADLGAVTTDLEKLALLGRRVTLADVEQETLVSHDVRAWQFAAALVAGEKAEALGLAAELFASDKSAAVPLLSALAQEYDLVWRLASGAEIEARDRWRAQKLAGVARRLGERRARRGFELAVRGFEAVVTGRTDDPRTIVEIVAAEAV